MEFIPKVYDVKIRKYNLIEINTGSSNQMNLKAANKIMIENTQVNGLGLPLPKGTVRVFKTDPSDDSLEFLGEDSIDHTPKDDNVTLNTGNAFDITADKVVSNYERTSSTIFAYTADSNLTIWNHKGIASEIQVDLRNYYGDNCRIGWVESGGDVEKVSASLYRIKRVFRAN